MSVLCASGCLCADREDRLAKCGVCCLVVAPPELHPLESILGHMRVCVCVCLQSTCGEGESSEGAALTPHCAAANPPGRGRGIPHELMLQCLCSLHQKSRTGVPSASGLKMNLCCFSGAPRHLLGLPQLSQQV